MPENTPASTNENEKASTDEKAYTAYLAKMKNSKRLRTAALVAAMIGGGLLAVKFLSVPTGESDESSEDTTSNE